MFLGIIANEAMLPFFVFASPKITGSDVSVSSADLHGAGSSAVRAPFSFELIDDGDNEIESNV